MTPMTLFIAAFVGSLVGGLIGTIRMLFRAMAQRERVRAFERGDDPDPYATWRGEDPYTMQPPPRAIPHIGPSSDRRIG